MNFFQGRYGSDQLGWFLFALSFALEIIGRIAHMRFIYYIGIILFVFMFARMFSRNIPKRQGENERFLAWWYRLTAGFRRPHRGSQNSGPVYCYFYCPSCKQQIRVPSGRGRIRVTCPKCKNSFETNT